MNIKMIQSIHSQYKLLIRLSVSDLVQPLVSSIQCLRLTLDSFVQSTFHSSCFHPFTFNLDLIMVAESTVRPITNKRTNEPIKIGIYNQV